MNASEIKAAIVSTLQAVRDNGNVVFKDVLAYATNEFTGYPSLTITSNSATSSFATTSENIRMYKFMIKIYTKDDTETSWAQITRLQDIVSNALDRSNDLNNADLILEPAQAEEIVAEVISGGPHIIASISVIIKAIKVV